MVTRRKLILSGAAGLLAATLPRAALAAPDDPAGIVTAIYTRAAKGKGDGGGGFVIENKAAKAKYLSKSLVALWARADARTRKGDVGPIDFDPVTNSQDPDVKSFKVIAEKQEADKATIAVTIESHQGTRRQTGRPDHALRFRPRGRPMEDRRHQGRRRRQAVVGPRAARRFTQALGFESRPAGHVWGRRALPAITADGWPVPDRSSANPARAEAHPAGRRLHRERHARREACRHRRSRG